MRISTWQTSPQLTSAAQLSLLMVVKESFKLYKAVSEGVINLADTFFEMSHLDAAKGLEIYKQYIAFTDLLQTYYTQVDQIEEIRSALKQPLDFHLATPPPEFLNQMEEYVREAPRALEDGSTAPAPVVKVSPLRRGQHSSRTGARPMAGGGQHPDPGMVFPPGGAAAIGSLELSSPREEPVAPAAPAGEIDLLALDFEQDVAVDTVRRVVLRWNACLMLELQHANNYRLALCFLPVPVLLLPLLLLPLLLLMKTFC